MTRCSVWLGHEAHATQRATASGRVKHTCLAARGMGKPAERHYSSRHGRFQLGVNGPDCILTACVLAYHMGPEVATSARSRAVLSAKRAPHRGRKWGVARQRIAIAMSRNSHNSPAMRVPSATPPSVARREHCAGRMAVAASLFAKPVWSMGLCLGGELPAMGANTVTGFSRVGGQVIKGPSQAERPNLRRPPTREVARASIVCSGGVASSRSGETMAAAPPETNGRSRAALRSMRKEGRMG